MLQRPNLGLQVSLWCPREPLSKRCSQSETGFPVESRQIHSAIVMRTSSFSSVLNYPSSIADEDKEKKNPPFLSQPRCIIPSSWVLTGTSANVVIARLGVCCSCAFFCLKPLVVPGDNRRHQKSCRRVGVWWDWRVVLIEQLSLCWFTEHHKEGEICFIPKANTG